MPLPQMLKPMTVSRATRAISQLVRQFEMADGARDRPMQMMIGPVTIGGK